MTLRLPRLQITQAIVGKDGRPSGQFQRFWQTFAEQIEAAITANAEAIAAAQAAQEAAEAADTAAANAQAVAAMGALANSYTTGLTISTADAGADITVTISAHTRVYGDGTSVAVDAGAVPAVPYATGGWLYYDQESRAGGPVVYQFTTNYEDAFPSDAHPDRHFVGTAPATAAAATGSGTPSRPPGYIEP